MGLGREPDHDPGSVCTDVNVRARVTRVAATMCNRGLKPWQALPAFLLLAACVVSVSNRPDFAHRLIPPGAVLVLEQAIIIPAEHSAVSIQDGRVVQAVDELRPYCTLQVRTRLETSREIAPDRFVVNRTNWGTSTIQAGLTPTVAEIGFGESGSLTRLYYQTELYLRSDRQPDVWRMVCEVDRVEAGGLSFDAYLTLSDVRATLKGVFRLQLDGKPAGA